MAHPTTKEKSNTAIVTKDKETKAPAQPPVINVSVTQPPNGMNMATLMLLIIFSAVLSPLIQSGLQRLAEIGLGVSHHTGDVSRHYKHKTIVSPMINQTQLQEPVVQQRKSLKSSGPIIDKDSYQCIHSYRAHILHRDPMIVILDDFLQPGEAEHMIAIASPKMARSSVIGPEKYSSARTSSTAYLEKSDDHVIRCIEERASHFSQIPVEATENLQVVWYTKGQEFRPHHDYLDLPDLMEDHWGQHGQRYVTFLAYMNEPKSGGATIFPHLGIDYKPKKNSAIFWYNVGLDEREDERTLHGGAPVGEGDKYAINIWQRKMIPSVAYAREMERANRAAAQSQLSNDKQKQDEVRVDNPVQEMTITETPTQSAL